MYDQHLQTNIIKLSFVLFFPGKYSSEADGIGLKTGILQTVLTCQQIPNYEHGACSSSTSFLFSTDGWWLLVPYWTMCSIFLSAVWSPQRRWACPMSMSMPESPRDQGPRLWSGSRQMRLVCCSIIHDERRTNIGWGKPFPTLSDMFSFLQRSKSTDSKHWHPNSLWKMNYGPKGNVIHSISGVSPRSLVSSTSPSLRFRLFLWRSQVIRLRGRCQTLRPRRRAF